MLSMLLSIIVAMVVFALVLTICANFEEPLPGAILKVTLIPAISALVYYWSPKVSPVLAMALLVLMVVVMLFMIIWWSLDGSSIKEFLLFFLTDLQMCMIAHVAAARIADLSSVKIIVGLVNALPIMIFILSIGYFIADMVWFHKGLKSDDFDPYDYLDEDEVVGGEVQ